MFFNLDPDRETVIIDYNFTFTNKEPEPEPEPPIIEYILGFMLLGIMILFGFLGRILMKKRGKKR